MTGLIRAAAVRFGDAMARLAARVGSRRHHDREGDQRFDGDRIARLPRDAFGKLLRPTDEVFGIFVLGQTPGIEAYVDSSETIVRVTLGEGERLRTDSDEAERAELNSAGVINPAFGSGDIELGMNFDVWIPRSIPVPEPDHRIAIAQMKVTGSSPALIIRLDDTGAIVARLFHVTEPDPFLGESMAPRHPVLVDAGSARGRWVNLDIDAIWSRTTNGQLILTADGVTKFARHDRPNIAPFVDDDMRVFLKFGIYANGLADGRGVRSVFFRSVTYRTHYVGADRGPAGGGAPANESHTSWS